MLERINEEVVAVAAVEPECHLIEVGRQMLRRHLMPCADDAALQEREGGFDGIRVDDAAHILPPLVPDGLVPLPEPESDQFIGRQFVGDEEIDVFFVDVFLQELVEGFGGHIFGAEEFERPAALADADDNLFVLLAMLPAPNLPADVGFVHFDYAAILREFGLLRFLHGGADTMAEVPCGFVRDPEGALHLIGREAFAGFDQQEDGGEPRFKGQVRIAEDRARRDGELIAAPALPLLPVGDGIHCFGLAPRAPDAMRPAQTTEQFTALLIGGVGA